MSETGSGSLADSGSHKIPTTAPQSLPAEEPQKFGMDPGHEISPDLLPARMLNEFAYCPRLFFLEWVQGEFEESADTVEGKFQHRRVDTARGTAPDAAVPHAAAPDAGSSDGSASGGSSPITGEAHAETGVGTEGGTKTDAAGEEPSDPFLDRATSLMLSAPGAGLIAKMDVVEFETDRCVPIDYKKGRLPPEGPYEPERVQLCAQGIILRANGYRCDEGCIYYAESRERVNVPFDESLLHRTLELAAQARRTAAEGRIPEPLADSPKCPGCSLVGICLPDETNFLSAHRAEVGPDDVRRLVPARDDRAPLYVQEQGAFVAKHGDCIQVRLAGDVVAEVREMDLSHINVYGSVQISTQLIQELCRSQIPVCYFSYGGWFNGLTIGLGHKNVELRRRQFALAGDPAASLRASSRFVRGKILNCRTLLRRNLESPPAAMLREMTRLAFTATRAAEIGPLLGLEGAAARLYFGHLGELLRPPEGEKMAFDFNGRNRRPPKDPVNCLLSFLYAILTKEALLAVQSVGFDPFLGFFHQPRYGRPALALDLMEEFRPLIVDSVVLQLVNTGEIRGRDFISRAGACTLTPSGRKRAIGALERRLEATVTHPLFGYSVSYRRILDIQARLLARWLGGEIPEYPPFRTR